MTTFESTYRSLTNTLADTYGHRFEALEDSVGHCEKRTPEEWASLSERFYSQVSPHEKLVLSMDRGFLSSLPPVVQEMHIPTLLQANVLSENSKKYVFQYMAALLKASAPIETAVAVAEAEAESIDIDPPSSGIDGIEALMGNIGNIFPADMMAHMASVAKQFEDSSTDTGAAPDMQAMQNAMMGAISPEDMVQVVRKVGSMMSMAMPGMIDESEFDSPDFDTKAADIIKSITQQNNKTPK